MLLLPDSEAADLQTLPEIFANSSLPPEPLAGPFGVCYVAFAGTHEKRYRGEKLLEVAAVQLSAASAARGVRVEQCVATDQPERPRPYVQLSVALRTPLDAAPFAARCEEYTRRFNRPCKLLFGYMAKAIAVARAPYAATVFVDTDTFVCDAGPLIALGTRLLASYDVLLHFPRTLQGWVNSGVIGVRRERARGWAMAWQREFLSLDDFGDQLHLLKVLPARAESAATATTEGGGGRALASAGRGGGGGGGGGGRRVAGRTREALAVGELPPELHVRLGSVAADAAVKLPVLRGPAMLLHSKGLASLGGYLPFFGRRFASDASAARTPAYRQLAAQVGDGTADGKRKGEHALYSPRALAGFCLMLNEPWLAPSAQPPPTGARQLALASEGECDGCAKLPRASGSVGVIRHESTAAKPAGAYTYECSPERGLCGVAPARWPVGTERGLPEWYRAFIERGGGGP